MLDEDHNPGHDDGMLVVLARYLNSDSDERGDHTLLAVNNELYLVKQVQLKLTLRLYVHDFNVSRCNKFTFGQM